MKNLIIVLIISLPTFGFTQNMFLVEEMVSTKDMSVNALIINMTDDFDEAVANYKEFVKDGYELKVKKKNNTTYVVEEVDLPHISVKRGDLKAYLFHTDSMNVMAFSFLLGYDVYLTREDHPEEMAQFKKFVVDFMDFHYKAHYSVGIDEQNKALESLKKELMKNENKISSLKKKVVSLAKKESKETDSTKKVEINAEKQLTQNEIDETVDLVTTMRVDVSKKEKEVFGLKNELNKCHLQITSL